MSTAFSVETRSSIVSFIFSEGPFAANHVTCLSGAACKLQRQFMPAIFVFLKIPYTSTSSSPFIKCAHYFKHHNVCHPLPNTQCLWGAMSPRFQDGRFYFKRTQSQYWLLRRELLLPFVQLQGNSCEIMTVSRRVILPWIQGKRLNLFLCIFFLHYERAHVVVVTLWKYVKCEVAEHATSNCD